MNRGKNTNGGKNTGNSIAAVGIDVAKSTLSVCILSQNGRERALTIRNTEADINSKLLPCISQCSAQVVMESTGHYHWLASLLLSENGVDVRVVNPILAKQYTSSNIRKVKTDPQDARGLARMALVADNLPESFRITRNALSLRKKLSTLASLSKHLQALHATLSSFKESQEILGLGEKDANSPSITEIRESVKQIKKSMRTLERECIIEAKQDEKVKAGTEKLSTIPGVSEFCSILSLHWFRPGEGVTAKSWIAYAGLDISSRESGTWKGKCKLTKRGNAFLRKRLYSAAWGAVMNNSDFKDYYDKLRSLEGRAHVEALTIISRKIVRIMYSILQLGTAYDTSKFTHKYSFEAGVS